MSKRITTFRRNCNRCLQCVWFVLYNDVCCRFSGPSLIEYLDGLPAVNRMNEGPLRIPILDRYKVRVPVWMPVGMKANVITQILKSRTVIIVGSLHYNLFHSAIYALFKLQCSNERIRFYFHCIKTFPLFFWNSHLEVDVLKVLLNCNWCTLL